MTTVFISNLLPFLVLVVLEGTTWIKIAITYLVFALASLKWRMDCVRHVEVKKLRDSHQNAPSIEQESNLARAY